MSGLGMRLGLQRFTQHGANVNLNPNDWYDPNFLRNWPDNTTISNIDPAKTDFAWARTNVSPVTLDGYNCVQYVLLNSILANIGPSFSRSFLASKGYEDGNTARIGFWLKVPLASPVKTFRLYKGGSAGTDPAITIDNSNWNWYEVVTDKVITSDTWQTFYIAVRDGSTGDKIYVRGLTLVNTTKDEWVGERISYSTVLAQNQQFLNLNGHFHNCPTWSNLFRKSFEQNGNPFTVEQITIADLGIKGARFTGVAGTQLKINLFPFEEYLDEIKDILSYHNLNSESGFFNIGFYVEVQSEMAYDGFGAYTNLRVGDTYFMFNIPFGERLWLETGPILIDSNYFEGDEKLSFIQCSVTSLPATTPVIDVYGVTVSVDSNKMKFRFNGNTISSNAKYKDKIVASYGDSITGNFGWQKPILINQGASKHYLRGIGGSTVKYNSTTRAWVTLDGEYIGRPPSAPPAGTEGVDYLEVYQGMCNQERIDTIPADTEVLFVLAGSNDYGQDAVIGTIGDAASDLSGATFYAAYKSMIDKLQLRLPTAEIIIINFPYMLNELTDTTENGDSYEDFRVAVRNVAALYALKIIETTNLGVNDSNWTDYSDDSIHPNHKYNQLIGYKILEEL